VSRWFFPRGTLAQGPWETVIDSSIEGWCHTGLRVATLAGEQTVRLEPEAIERLIVPLAGSFTVSHGDRTTVLEGRPSVFDGPTDVLYLGVSTAAEINGVGRVAVAEAPTEELFPAAHLTRDDIPVELRGSGRSSRQVHNFGTPQALAASRFIVCEVITPAENWSSYPPHKHDEYVPGKEARLEEIYYFETAVARGTTSPPTADPFGYLRTYASSAGEIDILAEVRTGDVGLIPHGWHGPCVAAPGYDLYYLNVMAGPDPERVWHVSDDPAHGWVRSTWDGQPLDARLPFRPATT
jgi:5-deoxy-glucuronate isomerase